MTLNLGFKMLIVDAKVLEGWLNFCQYDSCILDLLSTSCFQVGEKQDFGRRVIPEHRELASKTLGWARQDF